MTEGGNAMPPEMEAKVNDFINKCDKVFCNLYGDPAFPDMEGDIKQIKDHLAQINGSVKVAMVCNINQDNEIGNIKNKQEKLLSRIWDELPWSIKLPAGIWILMSLVSMVAGIKWMI